MRLSQTYLAITEKNAARKFLYAAGSTAGADHIERLLSGCAVVWIDAQHLCADDTQWVWDKLGEHLDNSYHSLLPYVFNHAVLSNTPAALANVCAWCVSDSETFTTVVRLLKNLQTFPVLPVQAHDFCTPLLNLVHNSNHLKTLVSNLCHQLHDNINDYNSDVLNIAIDFATEPLNNAKLLPQLVFSIVGQWDTIASRYPAIVSKLIDRVSFEDALLFGVATDYNRASAYKWRNFLQHGVDPSPLTIEDGGLPFIPASHTVWLTFVDLLIPLYQNLGYPTPLDHLQGMAHVTKNQLGLTVNTYQKQKFAAAVDSYETTAVKISKL